MSTPERLISVQHLSKAYRIWRDPSARLKAAFDDRLRRVLPPGAWRQRVEQRLSTYYRDFFALRDISFEVRRGEAVGIIGRNGSGKSTLLQIVAGTLQPTAGEVEVRGRVAALLELGSGFNPEFTGRDNVYLYASILGFDKGEIDRRFDEIASFADIGEFIDQPVRTYSSGMIVRLAFSVAACLDPEVLIVDEALAVGDVFFVQKCFTRVREILARGTTLLFVSHDLGAVQNLCSRALLLKDGCAIYEGPPEEAASRYYAAFSKGALPPRPAAASPAAPARSEEDRRAARRLALDHDLLPGARSRHGPRELELAAATLLDGQGRPSRLVRVGEVVTIHLLLQAHRAVEAPNVGIHLYDRFNTLVFAAGTRQLRADLSPMGAGEERLVSFEVELAVQPGDYTFSLGCAEPSAEGPNTGYLQDRHEGLGPVSVRADADDTWPFYGVARLPMRAHEWR